MSNSQGPRMGEYPGNNRLEAYFRAQDTALGSERAAPRIILSKGRDSSKKIHVNGRIHNIAVELSDGVQEQAELLLSMLYRLASQSLALQENFDYNKEMVAFELSMGASKNEIAKLGPSMKMPASAEGFISIQDFIGPLVAAGHLDTESAARNIRSLHAVGLIETKRATSTKRLMFKPAFEVEVVSAYGVK